MARIIDDLIHEANKQGIDLMAECDTRGAVDRVMASFLAGPRFTNSERQYFSPIVLIAAELVDAECVIENLKQQLRSEWANKRV